MALPPLKMTLSNSPKRNLRCATPPPKPPPKPHLTRRSSSLGRIVTGVVGQVELRYRSLRDAFRSIDRDGSGGVDKDELRAALFNWHVKAQGRHLDAMMAEFDTDGDEVISYAEFCAGLKPFTVASRPIFGLSDAHVTNRHRVLPNDGNRVLLNDNLSPLQRPMGSRRPDYELFELPHSASPASPEILKDHSKALADRIHGKFSKLRDAFRSFDENKDGKLSKQELLTAVRCFNLPIPRDHVIQLADLCDADQNGLIDYSEFAAVLKRKDALGM